VVADELDQLCDGHAALTGMPELQLVLDLIVVSAAFFRNFDVAVGDQIAHDALHSPFGDTDQFREIANTEIGISGEAQ